jgi:hypothetical protein
MKNKNLFNADTVVLDQYINLEGVSFMKPSYISSDFTPIDEHWYKVFKDQLKSPKGFTFAFYDKLKNNVTDKIEVEVNGEIEIEIIYATATDEFPEWNNKAHFIRFSKLHPEGYFDSNWLKTQH